MSTFVVTGRSISAPPPPLWREELARMLGAKPRRVGTWAELGLYGALRCMADAGEATLPEDAQLWLGSRSGTYAATELALAQSRDDLPMPLTFLQTQPTQLLALIAAQLRWTGHACFVAGSAPCALLQLAGVQAGAGGLLLGWVDETERGTSNWLRLRPVEGAHAGFGALPAGTPFSETITHVRIGGSAVEARCASAAPWSR